jgi:hypothetical protein
MHYLKNSKWHLLSLSSKEKNKSVEKEKRIDAWSNALRSKITTMSQLKNLLIYGLKSRNARQLPGAGPESWPTHTIQRILHQVQ